jgi:hypothetical protein
MGVDYDGVGGVGVGFDMHGQAIEKGLFTESDWDESPGECMELIEMPFSTAGSAYSGEETFYLMVEGKTLGEINANAASFCSKVNDKFGTDLTPAGLQVISDLYIW